MISAATDLTSSMRSVKNAVPFSASSFRVVKMPTAALIRLSRNFISLKSFWASTRMIFSTLVASFSLISAISSNTLAKPSITALTAVMTAL